MPPTSPGRRPRPPRCCHSSTASLSIPRTMSLLSNYEGLRHQIERLVRENEELKKLVRLIQENHELKSAIKSQACAMGISGIDSMFNEGLTVCASPTSDRKSVFSPSGPESTHDPGLDELGILTSLAEILNNSQSSALASSSTCPASSPLTGPLPRPLNNTIPGSVAVLPNNPLFSFITGTLNNQPAGSIAVSPKNFQTNPLPYSTAAPSSSPAIGSGTVPLPISPASSLLTGPLSDSSNSPLTVGPMTGPTNSPSFPAASVGIPLIGSMAVPPTTTSSTSLPGSVDAPIAVPPKAALSATLMDSRSSPPGNLLPSPKVNNVLLIDPNQPHPTLDAALHSSSSPSPSANIPASAATVPKVIIPTDDNKTAVVWEPSSDVEPFNMAFMSQPGQTSTPIGTPITTFFGPPEAMEQYNTSIPAMSSVLPCIPIAGTIPTSALPVTVTSSSQLTADATSLHQGAPASSPPNLNAIICQDISNTTQRNNLQPSPALAFSTHISFSPSHSPPSPQPRSSSTNNAQGPRSLEPTNKKLLEMDRKMAHRKTSKYDEPPPRDPKQLTWERLVGEIAFQLDRRILSNIFPERVRLYGFTVSNIPEKIIQASLNTSNHKMDEELCQTLTQRYVSVMNRLQSLGYNGRVHPGLTEQLVNAYGILRERPELAASEGGSYTMDFLQRVIIETVPPSVLNDALLLLSCLNQLSHDDGKPMFIW
ncbi:speriolin [Petaurus breviceps papuanus]|uniref:speriolin n=1 Tax=Petaurus breviceps papuanus TaxID=3040969 RepID=UPI0036D94998